ncbi:MAG: FG-GAP repeat protein [Bacteroidia bacterium]
MQKIVAPDRKAFDWFGYSVAISGDYAVVGAQREGDDILSGSAILSSGSAYIFYNQAGTWTQVQKIVASDRAPSDFFGYSVAISGDYVVVGAESEDEDASGGNTLDRAGSAYLFYNQAGTWTQVQKIVASDRETTDFSDPR